MHDKQTQVNKLAWNTMAYEAWLHGLGTPAEQAHNLAQDPRRPLRRWLKYIEPLEGRQIINLLGSHGGKAIPLALLGADVTVVDISEENRRYAMEVAEHAGVNIHYINSDVMDLPHDDNLSNFDIVLMEFGVLHYFSDLHALFSLVTRLLHDHGRFILTDFHPFAAKLLQHSEHGVILAETADYFHSQLIESPIAYTQFIPENERSALHQVLLRKWTLSEIITALCSNQFVIRGFDEEPHPSDSRFPAFYTMVSDKLRG